MRFKLSDLICHEYNSDVDLCTQFGDELARNFIKSASNNIFEKKERAIIELPINSVDAYRSIRNGRDKAIGKFGMGFYSLFTYLVDESSYIIVNSRTKNEEWVLTLTLDDGAIMVDYVENKKYNNNKSNIHKSNILKDLNHNIGTNIIIRSNNLDLIKIQNILSQYLQFIPDCIIRYNNMLIPEVKWLNESYYRYNERNLRRMIVSTKMLSESVPQLEGKSLYNDIIRQGFVNNHDLIMIDIKEKNIISITDYATGISSDILFRNLLIPSSSSKGILIDRDYFYLTNQISGIYNIDVKQKTQLFLLIGDLPISVRSIDFGNKNFIIQMPKNTPLSVSRDKIIFNTDIRGILLEQLENLSKQIAISDTKYLGWVLKSIIQIVNEVWLTIWVQDYIRTLPNKNIYLLDIDPMIIKTLEEIFNIKVGNINSLEEDISPEITLLSAEHTRRLEEFIIQHGDRYISTIFQNKIIIPVQYSMAIYTGNFTQLMFVNESLLNQPEDIIIAYPEEGLSLWTTSNIGSRKELLLERLMEKIDGFKHYVNVKNENLLYQSAKQMLNLEYDTFYNYVSKIIIYINFLIKEIIDNAEYGFSKYTYSLYGGDILDYSHLTTRNSTWLRYNEYLISFINDYLYISRKNNILSYLGFTVSYLIPMNERLIYFDICNNLFEYIILANLLDQLVVRDNLLPRSNSPVGNLNAELDEISFVEYYTNNGIINSLNASLIYFRNKLDTFKSKEDIIIWLTLGTPIPWFNELILMLNLSINSKVINVLPKYGLKNMNITARYFISELIEACFHEQFIVSDVVTDIYKEYPSQAINKF